MHMQLGKATLAAIAAAIVVGTLTPMSSQTPSAARTADGKPNLTGIWQVMNTANWDIQTHPARQGPVVALGAAFSVPPGVGVVEGNEIPYQPGAAAKKKENGDNWMTRDPEVKCFMPGIPRATYMPFPFQIVQSANTILMAYEFTTASRIVRMNSKEREPRTVLDGLVRRPLGRRHAGHRRDRPDGRHLVRPRRELPQRRAPRRRALHRRSTRTR